MTTRRVGLQGMWATDFAADAGGSLSYFPVDPQRAHSGLEAAIRELVADLPAAARDGVSVLVVVKGS